MGVAKRACRLMTLHRCLADLLKSSLCCVQVLNNFTTFYITHQIFFLTFVLLFILHPIPGHSNVYGKREKYYPHLPICYSWVSSFLCLTTHSRHMPGGSNWGE